MRLKAVWISLLVVLLAAAGVWRWMNWKHARTARTPPHVSVASLDSTLKTIIETSRMAVVQAPGSSDAWGKLGEALHAAEFNGQARFCYSNAMFLDPKTFRWPYLRGLLELRDQPDQAILHLSRATELAGDKSDAPRYQLGRALIERGRHEEAAPHLQSLVAANPNHAAARLELARVHFSRNALREGTREIQPALSNSYTMRQALAG
jgi:tetratricopeptide (TPR) repeat protein